MSTVPAVPFQSAAELLASLDRGELSSRELLELFIERHGRLNARINAIVDTDFDGARTRAAQADEARSRGESWGPMHGLPVTIKDSIEVLGMRSTFGCKDFAGYRSVRNADVVESLLAAGAIVFGKTNVPLWADDTQTFNDVHGQTDNPWDTSRTPGGSSGGAAAAIAAGLSGLEMGSDIGSSIRSPAAFCGVYGHKPTYGIVPVLGMGLPDEHLTHDYAIKTDLLVTGPLARSAEDLALAMEVVVQPGRPQRKAVKIELPPPRRQSLKDYRIGVWIDDPLFGPDRDVGDRLQHAVDALAKAGAQVVDRRPDLDFAGCFRVYTELLTLASVHMKPQGDIDQLLALSRATTDEARKHPLYDYARSTARTHREWKFLHGARAMMRKKWDDYFGDVDVMLCPVARVAAFPHDHTTFSERTTRLDDRDLSHAEVVMPWAGLITMAYLPSTVAPVGLTPGGLPVGVQIVGPYLEDRTPIHVAQLMKDVTGGFTPPPGFD